MYHQWRIAYCSRTVVLLPALDPSHHARGPVVYNTQRRDLVRQDWLHKVHRSHSDHRYHQGHPSDLSLSLTPHCSLTSTGSTASCSTPSSLNCTKIGDGTDQTGRSSWISAGTYRGTAHGQRWYWPQLHPVLTLVLDLPPQYHAHTRTLQSLKSWSWYHSSWWCQLGWPLSYQRRALSTIAGTTAIAHKPLHSCRRSQHNIEAQLTDTASWFGRDRTYSTLCILLDRVVRSRPDKFEQPHSNYC